SDTLPHAIVSRYSTFRRSDLAPHTDRRWRAAKLPHADRRLLRNVDGFRLIIFRGEVDMSDVMDRVSETGHDTVLLAARVTMAAIFLPSGFQKLTHLGTFAGMLAQHGVPDATLLAPIGACVEFFGALLILTGTRIRWAALLMAAFTVVAALISHRFWELGDAAARTQQQVQ